MVVVVIWRNVVEVSRSNITYNKTLYKLELGLLKIIPMLLAGCYLLDTILSYFYIDLPIFSILGGMSILPLIFLYISSYVFHFCEYHRMFLHYVVVNDILSWIDYSYELPIDNFAYFTLHIAIAGIFLFIILYLKVKYGIHTKGCSKIFKGTCRQVWCRQH
jgi:hypothetical protein